MGNFFIRRPIVAMVLSIVTVIVGAVSLSGCHLAVPEITPPLIQVTTTYVGANALDVEQTVATPIEAAGQRRRAVHLHEVHQRKRGTLKLEVSFRRGLRPPTSTTSSPRTASRRPTPALPTDVKNYG